MPVFRASNHIERLSEMCMNTGVSDAKSIKRVSLFQFSAVFDFQTESLFSVCSGKAMNG